MSVDFIRTRFHVLACSTSYAAGTDGCCQAGGSFVLTRMGRLFICRTILSMFTCPSMSEAKCPHGPKGRYVCHDHNTEIRTRANAQWTLVIFAGTNMQHVRSDHSHLNDTLNTLLFAGVPPSRPRPPSTPRPTRPPASTPSTRPPPSASPSTRSAPCTRECMPWHGAHAPWASYPARSSLR